MENEKLACKIRLMFGISYISDHGFSIVYEPTDSCPGSISIWSSDVRMMNKLKFIDDGDSVVIWRKEHKRFGKFVWVVDAIEIRRDFQDRSAEVKITKE